MIAKIETRTNNNIERVRNLVGVYRQVAGPGKGRRPVADTDILRSAVVLLHATLEDFLRSIARWKWQAAGPEVLASVPLVGKKPNETKHTLGDLASHRTTTNNRNKTVSELIIESIDHHLDRTTYNNTNEIAAMLTTIGVDVQSVNTDFRILDELTARRHDIVHRADRQEAKGQGNHSARRINPEMVQKWVEAVERFTQDVVRAVS